MKTIAILLDGAFVLHRLYMLLGHRQATADDVYDFALACAAEDEEIFRIYYYDCPPYEETHANPLSPTRPIHFSGTRTAQRCRRLQQELALMDMVAFRRGQISFDGWALRQQSQDDLLAHPESPRAIEPIDLKPKFRQKLVDMNIGLDVAWLASKRIADRIVLVTGDADFVPAMKFARREGTQVVLVPMGHKYIKSALREHADFVRHVKFPLPLFSEDA